MILVKKKPISGKESPREFAARVQLKLRNYSLLSRALTHRSFINEHPEELEDNERLEFLGDAILDFVVGDWLYNRYPEMLEGELTQMRSALVQTPQLADFATQIHLGGAIRMGKGEEIAGGQERISLLCDSFEALVGAIYLDCGIDEIQSFLSTFLEKATKDILINHKNEDPKSKLQEWAQSLGYSAPVYLLRNTSGPDHQKIFEVEVVVNNKNYGYGKGNSKQQAEKMAARAAIERIDKNMNKGNE